MMRAKVQRRLRFETVWLQGFASTYLVAETNLTLSPECLRQAGVSIVQLLHVFRSGVVVDSDQLDRPGARWIVEGVDNDDVSYVVSVVVVSDIYSVTVESITRVVVKKEKPHDAA